MQTWKTEREENAVSLSELNGYYHAQLQLQDLANKLNELDTKKGKYLTG
ncbi:VasL domain-containing protein, partial [Thorsellia anophelis]